MCQICPEAVQITGANRGGRQSAGISSGISNPAALIVFLAWILLEKGVFQLYEFWKVLIAVPEYVYMGKKHKKTKRNSVDFIL